MISPLFCRHGAAAFLPLKQQPPITRMQIRRLESRRFVASLVPKLRLGTQLSAVTLLLGLAFATSLSAQTMAPTNLTTDTAAPTQSAQPPVEPVTETTAAPAPSNDIARPGPAVSESERRFRYDLGLNVHEIYDDNILLLPTNKISDWFTRVAPSIHFGWGDVVGHHDNFLDATYTPAFVFFAKEDAFNTVEHVAHIAGGGTFGHLSLGASEDIIATETGDPQLTAINGTFVNGVNIDTSGRRRIQTYGSQVTASYDLTGKTFLSAQGDYMISDYPHNLDSSQRAAGSMFVNYRYGDKLVFGVGGTGGHDFRETANTDEDFEQANVRASYILTDKLSANGTFGIEFRQRETGGSTNTPVFDLSLAYTPTDSTSVSIQGSRRVINSAGAAGQDYNSTQFQISLQQRFLQRIFASVTGGYQNLDYVNSPAGFPSRQDDYFFIQPSIDVRVTNFWFVGGFYNYRKNDSNFVESNFEENQAGFHTSFRF